MEESCVPDIDFKNIDYIFLASLIEDGVKGAREEFERREKEMEKETVKSVSGPLDVARALSRLTILPNPNDPTLEDSQDYVESPWPVVPVPMVNPNDWDDAEIVLVNLDDLYGTDPYLDRENVEKHIEAMGQSLRQYRSYAMIVQVDGQQVIIDGHHRLMALWLLGHEVAPAYLIEVK